MNPTDPYPDLRARSTPRSLSLVSIWTCLLLLLFGIPSSACQICLPFPTESLADRILAAEHLVLARENPEQPYTLAPIRSLEGASATPMDVFLDSSSRRWLSFDPNRSILCGWFGEEGGWKYLARHGALFAPVLQDILSRRQQWQDDPIARARYFADYLAHDDRLLAELAHLEVARAPYSVLIHYADRISREQLLEKLGNPRMIEWQALYILLLAQHDHPDDHELIHAKVTRNAKWSLTLQTAAWATALIEIDGADGIDRLSELYLGEAEREPEELAAIHAALRVHGNEGRPELREPVVAAYGKLLEHHPSLAADLADDLTKWNRFDHTAAFTSHLREQPSDLLATARIRQHLRAAEAPPDKKRVGQDGAAGLPLALVGGLLLIVLAIPFLGRGPKSPPATERSPKTANANQ